MKELCPREDDPGWNFRDLSRKFRASRKFWEKPEVPAPKPEVPEKAGSSGKLQNFWETLKKGLFGFGLLDSDPNCSKFVGNLENKPWRGFLLG
jgi:hypothetical protein